VGGAVTARSGKALQKALEVHAADSPEVGLLMRRIQFGLLADVVILTAIVFVMTPSRPSSMLRRAPRSSSRPSHDHGGAT